MEGFFHTSFSVLFAPCLCYFLCCMKSKESVPVVLVLRSLISWIGQSTYVFAYPGK